MNIFTPLNKLVPFSKARNNLSRLIDSLQKEQFLVITKQNKQKAILVDADYFFSLLQQEEKQRLASIETTLRAEFTRFAQKKLKKKTITEKDAYKLLTGKDLSW